MIDQIKKIIAPLQRRIFMAIARGIINTIDDTKSIQKLQVSLLADEVIDNLDRIQQYGFTSYPQNGAEAVALFVAGNRDHGIIIATDDRRYRKKNLAQGEVALYTDEGDYIHFKRNGEIWIQAGAKVKVTAPNVEVIASTKVTLTTPLVSVSGDLTVTGAVSAAAVSAAGVSIATIKADFNSHTHISAAPGVATATPLPVIP